MTNEPPAPSRPPLPSGDPAPRKGLGLLAWLAIGAVAVFVLIGIVVAVGGYFLVTKVRQLNEDSGGNPALVAARMAVMANPDLEIVETDAGKGTLTIRHRATNEQLTVDFEDIRAGRLSFQTDKGTVRLDADADDRGASLTVETPEGTARFESGPEAGRMRVTTPGEGAVTAGTGAAVPEWIPLYPGTAPPTSVATVESQDGTLSTFQVTTEDTPGQILAYYEDLLPTRGFAINVARSPAVSIVEATDAAAGRTLGITIPLPGDQGTILLYHGQEKKVP